MATKHHDATADSDAALLVDVDLCILGRSAELFWEYEAAIHREFEWVPKALFIRKRAEVLQRFLIRPRIYHTEWFFQRCESRARDNVKAAIRRLSGEGEE